MKLSFLGTPYETTPQTIDTTPLDQSARFRGNPYQVGRPVQPISQAQLGLRKYRGLTYSPA